MEKPVAEECFCVNGSSAQKACPQFARSAGFFKFSAPRDDTARASYGNGAEANPHHVYGCKQPSINWNLRCAKRILFVAPYRAGVV
jgi:hypothetical protein